MKEGHVSILLRPPPNYPTKPNLCSPYEGLLGMGRLTMSVHLSPSSHVTLIFFHTCPSLPFPLSLTGPGVTRHSSYRGPRRACSVLTGPPFPDPRSKCFFFNNSLVPRFFKRGVFFVGLAVLFFLALSLKISVNL